MEDKAVSVALTFHHPADLCPRDRQMFEGMLEDRIACEIGRKVLKRVPISYRVHPGDCRRPSHMVQDLPQLAEITVYVFTKAELDALLSQVKET